MSGRCKSCNVILFDTELSQKIEDEEGNFLGYEDLCNRCRNHSMSEFDYVEDHEHIHNNLEEGLFFGSFYRE